ncbi:MAG: hypothetical protein WC901_02845 [Candidatus Margulisiibacteriota bacterium]
MVKVVRRFCRVEALQLGGKFAAPRRGETPQLVGGCLLRKGSQICPEVVKVSAGKPLEVLMQVREHSRRHPSDSTLGFKLNIPDEVRSRLRVKSQDLLPGAVSPLGLQKRVLLPLTLQGMELEGQNAIFLNIEHDFGQGSGLPPYVERVRAMLSGIVRWQLPPEEVDEADEGFDADFYEG